MVDAEQNNGEWMRREDEGKRRVRLMKLLRSV